MRARAAALAVVAAAAGAAGVASDIGTFETFTPKVISSVFGEGKYAERVEVSVHFKGTEYLVDLTVNRELFAPDWSLEEYGDDGKLVRRVTDTADFMCHYTGAVRGEAGSFATMSLCDELGLRGHIHTAALDIEVQHAVSLSVAGPKPVSGDHIVFDLKALKLDGFVLGEPLPGNVTKPPHHPLPRRYEYSNSAVVASDSYRMNAFSSSDAEATNTQSVMNHANSPYSATSWGSGNTLLHTIRSQAQNPSGWSHSNDMLTHLTNLGSYRRNEQSGADNVQGFTHYSVDEGDLIGLAYLNSMCGSDSAALNNVGFTSSDSARGILVAHEMGHNYAFLHDSNNQGGSGYVMWPNSMWLNPRQFSSFSISTWNSHRGGFNCL